MVRSQSCHACMLQPREQCSGKQNCMAGFRASPDWRKDIQKASRWDRAWPVQKTVRTKARLGGRCCWECWCQSNEGFGTLGFKSESREHNGDARQWGLEEYRRSLLPSSNTNRYQWSHGNKGKEGLSSYLLTNYHVNRPGCRGAT